MPALILHPTSPCRPIAAVSATAVRRGPDQLDLRYTLHGDSDGIWWPGITARDRADGLWHRTCLELFVRAPGSKAYAEFNLSPDGRWAAYAFADFRVGMAQPAVVAPVVATLRTAGRLELAASIAIAAFPGLDPAAPLDLALTAIIEDEAGVLSYWALCHPAATPDFHHPGGFTLHLPEYLA